uniref:Uncharacterized protein n=1 Tax=Anopheles quadriannulatus TaxID=34691 RepID=A0A182XTZ4_ANOQN
MLQCVVALVMGLFSILAMHEGLTVILGASNICPQGMRLDHRGVCRNIFDWHDSDAISA